MSFDRTKYGRELQVDATWVRQTPGFITDSSPHVLAFHELLLVTSGRGSVLLEGERIAITSGCIIFCLPGQERVWHMKGKLNGACLCFTDDFVTDVFADVRFLQRFAYFGVNRLAASIRLDAAQQRLFRSRFADMRDELTTLRVDTQDRLRATLYELLVLLDRWYRDAVGLPAPALPAGVVDRFQRLVNRDFGRRHRVADYARELGCTPGYLNHVCRTRIQQSAGSIIRRRIVLEARRLLLHTGLGAAQISQKLGFEDPAYFSRFIRRETGFSPSRLRAGGIAPAL